MLDIHPISIPDALEIAYKYYDGKTYMHVTRVAGYVASNKMVPIPYREECFALALMHDLIEDTDYDPSDLPPNFKEALMLLTKDKDVKYEDYCTELSSDKAEDSIRMCAYWVKIADMKDHLRQTETLTERLKEKYIKGLAQLL